MVGDETTASEQKGVNQSAYHLRSNDESLLDFPRGKMLIFFCYCSHMVECITHLVKEIKNSSKV